MHNRCIVRVLQWVGAAPKSDEGNGTAGVQTFLAPLLLACHSPLL